MTLLTLMIWKYLNLKKPIPFCSTSDLCCDYEHFQNWMSNYILVIMVVIYI